MERSLIPLTPLEKLRVPDLKAEAKLRGLHGYSKLRKAELLDLLTGKMPEVMTTRSSRKNLVKLCKERNIKYITNMSKQEMIEVLKLNDEDSSVNVHPDAQKRVTEHKTKYRDNPEQREKAKKIQGNGE